MMSAKTTGRPVRRRALRGVGMTLLAVLVLAGIAHGLAWLWLTGAMTVALSDWVTLQRSRGWVVEHALPERAGWPFAARVSLPAVRIAGWLPALPQGFEWEAARVDLSIAPPQLDHLTVSAGGAQRITAGGVTVPYAAARLQAVLPLERGPPTPPVTFLLEGLRATTPAGPLAAARIDARAMPGQPYGEPSLGLRVDAWQVILPPLPEVAAFGRQLDHAVLDAVLTGLPPPMALSPRDRAAAWRAAGGTLDLREVSLRWGPLVGTLQMVLRLDAALQPVGGGELTLEHPAAVVAALADAGMVAPRPAAAAQVMLGMLARSPEGGGAPRVEVPVGIEQGSVTLARIPLLRLRPVIWSDQLPYQR
jgi:hypothetical protein